MMESSNSTQTTFGKICILAANMQLKDASIGLLGLQSMTPPLLSCPGDCFPTGISGISSTLPRLATPVTENVTDRGFPFPKCITTMRTIPTHKRRSLLVSARLTAYQ
ncbi:hypothetical protein ACLKA7_000974 [Drosophila subpalustris]